MNKKIVAGLLIILAIGLGSTLFFLSQSKPVATQVVTLTPDGFKPEQITIKKGDKVTFKNTTGSPFWPASDIHPTHGIYPEFDPKEAIAKDSTWTFKFDKAGSWGYHDHLAPYFMGRIIVK